MGDAFSVSFILSWSYKKINKETVFRSLTVFARKGDLKISVTGAP